MFTAQPPQEALAHAEVRALYVAELEKLYARANSPSKQGVAGSAGLSAQTVYTMFKGITVNANNHTRILRVLLARFIAEPASVESELLVWTRWHEALKKAAATLSASAQTDGTGGPTRDASSGAPAEKGPADIEDPVGTPPAPLADDGNGGFPVVAGATPEPAALSAPSAGPVAMATDAGSQPSTSTESGGTSQSLPESDAVPVPVTLPPSPGPQTPEGDSQGDEGGQPELGTGPSEQDPAITSAAAIDVPGSYGGIPAKPRRRPGRTLTGVVAAVAVLLAGGGYLVSRAAGGGREKTTPTGAVTPTARSAETLPAAVPSATVISNSALPSSAPILTASFTEPVLTTAATTPAIGKITGLVAGQDVWLDIQSVTEHRHHTTEQPCVVTGSSFMLPTPLYVGMPGDAGKKFRLSVLVVDRGSLAEQDLVGYAARSKAATDPTVYQGETTLPAETRVVTQEILVRT